MSVWVILFYMYIQPPNVDKLPPREKKGQSADTMSPSKIHVAQFFFAPSKRSHFSSRPHQKYIVFKR